MPRFNRKLLKKVLLILGLTLFLLWSIFPVWFCIKRYALPNQNWVLKVILLKNNKFFNYGYRKMFAKPLSYICPKCTPLLLFPHSRHMISDNNQELFSCGEIRAIDIKNKIITVRHEDGKQGKYIYETDRTIFLYPSGYKPERLAIVFNRSQNFPMNLSEGDSVCVMVAGKLSADLPFLNTLFELPSVDFIEKNIRY